MKKNKLIFIITFLVGALIALAVRTAWHDPYQPQKGAHVASTESAKPVNSVCAVCGMDVDPKIQTAQYQGKPVGFGCNKCPPKFAAEPDVYGPAALANEVVK